MTKWRKHYHTKRGYLLTRHRDMRKRVNGKPDGGGKNCPWLGMEVCDRDDFYNFAVNDPTFNRLFDEWAAAGCPRRLAPCVHRINRSLGYRLDNIEFRTHEDKTKEVIPLMHAARATKRTVLV